MIFYIRVRQTRALRSTGGSLRHLLDAAHALQCTAVHCELRGYRWALVRCTVALVVNPFSRAKSPQSADLSLGRVWVERWRLRESAVASYSTLQVHTILIMMASQCCV
jgi:hypothetical protein